MTQTTFRKSLLVLSLCCAAYAMAQEDNAETTQPEWGMEMTSEIQATAKGKVNLANLLRLHASIPLSDRLSVDAASLSTYMTGEESIGEDLQTFSNLDAGNIPFALAVCGLNYRIDDRNTLFAGIRNMNEDYFASPVTSFFTNSSWGIYPTLSTNYTMANYPLASVGVHYRYEAPLSQSESSETTDAITLQASVYNGIGYNRFTGRNNIFRVCPQSDGVFALAEAQYRHRGASYFVGSSLYCRSTVSVTPWIYTEQGINDRLSLIAGYSHAFVADSDCSDFLGIGAHYQLPKAEIGVFTDYAHFAEADEWATELTCSFSVASHLSLRPSTHVIVTNNTLTAALTLRLTVEL